MNDKLKRIISFKSDKFKTSGNLREEEKNINNFYGYDLACWLCEMFPYYQFDFISEDWGFHIYSSHDLNFLYSIEVGGLSEDNDGEWQIVISTEQVVPLFLIFSRYAQIQCCEKLEQEILATLATVATDISVESV